MELRVAELADAAGVGVDTVRFYQSRSLIPAPTRRGRFAIYSEEHLERIRRIRELLDGGFSLAQIHRLLDGEIAETAEAAESSTALDGIASAPPSSSSRSSSPRGC